MCLFQSFTFFYCWFLSVWLLSLFFIQTLSVSLVSVLVLFWLLSLSMSDIAFLFFRALCVSVFLLLSNFLSFPVCCFVCLFLSFCLSYIFPCLLLCFRCAIKSGRLNPSPLHLLADSHAAASAPVALAMPFLTLVATVTWLPREDSYADRWRAARHCFL